MQRKIEKAHLLFPQFARHAKQPRTDSANAKHNLFVMIHGTPQKRMFRGATRPPNDAPEWADEP
jgi:hypothetical protein